MANRRDTVVEHLEKCDQFPCQVVVDMAETLDAIEQIALQVSAVEPDTAWDRTLFELGLDGRVRY